MIEFYVLYTAGSLHCASKYPVQYAVPPMYPSNINSVWVIVELETQSLNGNSNTAAVAAHIDSEAEGSVLVKLNTTVLQKMMEINLKKHTAVTQHIHSKQTALNHTHTSNSCCVTTPSAMSLSEYFFSTCSCRRICLYISGWVNMGSSISLWPKRL